VRYLIKYFITLQLALIVFLQCSLSSVFASSQPFALTVHLLDSNGNSIDQTLSTLDNTTIYIGVGWGSWDEGYHATAGETTYNPNKNLTQITSNGAIIQLEDHPYNIWAGGYTLGYNGKFDLKICKVCTDNKCDIRVSNIAQCQSGQSLSSTAQINGWTVANTNNSISYQSGNSFKTLEYSAFSNNSGAEVLKYSSGKINYQLDKTYYTSNSLNEGQLIINFTPTTLATKDLDTLKQRLSSNDTNNATLHICIYKNNELYSHWYKHFTNEAAHWEGEGSSNDPTYSSQYKMPSISRTYVVSENISLNIKVGGGTAATSCDNMTILSQIKSTTIYRNQSATQVDIDLNFNPDNGGGETKTAQIDPITCVEKRDGVVSTETIQCDIDLTDIKTISGKQETINKTFHINNTNTKFSEGITTDEEQKYCISSAKGPLSNPDNLVYQLPTEKCITIKYSDLHRTENNVEYVDNKKVIFALAPPGENNDGSIESSTTSTTNSSTVSQQQQSNTTSDVNATGSLEASFWTTGGVKPVTAQAPFFGTSKTYTSMADYLNDFYYYAIWLIVAIVIVMIIYGGYLIITSSGNPEGVNKGRGIIVSALTALLVLILAYVILRIISPQIVENQWTDLPQNGMTVDNSSSSDSSSSNSATTSNSTGANGTSNSSSNGGLIGTVVGNTGTDNVIRIGDTPGGVIFGEQ